MSNVFRSLLIDSIFEMEYNPIVPYARVAWVLTCGSILFDDFLHFLVGCMFLICSHKCEPEMQAFETMLQNVEILYCPLLQVQ